MFVLQNSSSNLKNVSLGSLLRHARAFLIASLQRILFAPWLYGLVFALILFGTIQSAAPSPCTSDPNPALDGNTNTSADTESAFLLEASYKRAWQLVKDNTMYPERLKNWNTWEHKYDGKISTTKQLEDCIMKMLSSLGDQYTYFRNSSDTQSWHTHDEENSVVSAYKMPSNIAYVAIHSFSSLHTASELESALQQVQNAVAYIVDLRGNRGGYVEQALASFELMSDNGTFVTMAGREDGKPYSEELTLQGNCVNRTVNGFLFVEARRKNLCGIRPITILIDEDTKSAAEMFAGALRDNKRAKLVGTRSYGKGIVQSSWVIEPGCSIKISMAHYYLPSGKDINGEGLLPDVLIDFASSRLTRIDPSDKSKPLNSAQLQKIMQININGTACALRR